MRRRGPGIAPRRSHAPRSPPSSRRGSTIPRRFLAYLGAAATADAGYWIAAIAQGWLVVTLTDSALWLGLVSAASQLPFLLFSLAGGSIADRYDRRIVVAAGNGAIAALALFAAALVVTGTVNVAWICAIGFAGGTLIALEHPVDRAWVYDLVEGRALGRAIALSALEWAAARTVGPALGGAAVAAVGIAAGYAAYALCVVPLILLAIVVRTRNASGDAGGAAPREDEGAVRRILAFCAFTAAFTIGVAPYQTLLPEIVAHAFHGGAALYAAMSAAGGVGAIAGAVTLSVRGGVRHPGRVATIAAFVGALLLVAFTQVHALVPAFGLLVAMGTVDTLMYALANTYVQEIAGDAERGRANAVFSLAFLGGFPVGNALLGPLAAHFGSFSVLACSASLVALAAAAFWFGFPGARDAAGPAARAG